MTAVALTNVAGFGVEELDARAMREVEGGVLPAWVAGVLGGLVVSFITNLPDFVEGISDGYNAVR